MKQSWVLCQCSWQTFLSSTSLMSLRNNSHNARTRLVPRVLCFNHAGASPSSDAVVQRVTQHLQLEQSVGGYAAAQAVQDELNTVYQLAATLIHANSPSEIALVESATVAWTRLFYSMAAHQEQHLKTPNKIILVAQAEYAANVVAACQWAKMHHCHGGSSWSVWPLPSAIDGGGVNTGKVDVPAFKSMLAGTYSMNDGSVLDPACIAMVCVTHVPTNAGLVNPMVEIGRAIAEYNEKHRTLDGTNGANSPIFYLADTCQSVGHLEIDVQDMKCSGLVATGRKYLRGPRGTGFLFVPTDIADRLAPHHVDHYSVPVTAVPKAVDVFNRPLQQVLSFSPRPGARRFEFWESNVAGKLGLGQALAKVLEVGQAQITASVVQRTQYLVDRLHELDYIQLHHQAECGIVTFWVPNMPSAELADALQSPTPALDDSGLLLTFEVSVVPATSTPVDSAVTQVPDLLRASVSYTTTTDEIDLFIQRLTDILKK